MRLVDTVFVEQDDKISKFTAVLLFLFPIAGVSIRSWYSGIATLVILTGLYITISKFITKTPLFPDYSKDEKRLMFLIATLFFFISTSGFISGWNANQFDSFLGEMNFIFFIPLYIAIKDVNNTAEIILKGTVVAGITIFIIYLNEVWISPSVTENRIGRSLQPLIHWPNGCYFHMLWIDTL